MDSGPAITLTGPNTMTTVLPDLHLNGHNASLPTSPAHAKTQPVSSNGHHGKSDATRLRALYESADQGHVFTFYDELPPAEQASLLAQLADIDPHRVNRIYHNAVAADGPITPPPEVVHDDSLAVAGVRMIGRSRTPSPVPEEVLPLPEEACASIVNNPQDEATWRERGLDAIAANQVAVLLMAGGQGTRLGSTSPKGMYDIGLPSGLSLFEYQAGRIKKLERVAEQRAGKPQGSVRIRWYVMTSGPTREETEKYFAKKAFFGLDPQDIIFFEQGECVH